MQFFYNEFISNFYEIATNSGPNIKRWWCAPYKVNCYLLNTPFTNLHSWDMTYLLSEFLEIGNNMSAVLFYSYAVLTLHSWHMFFNVPWREKGISCLMICSFCKYSISCTIRDWWWPKLGAKTSCHLINIFIKVCWLWFEVLSDLCDWYAKGDISCKVYSNIHLIQHKIIWEFW
jgi:hypothetical protein